MAESYVGLFEGAVRDLFQQAVRIVLRSPRLLTYLLQVRRWQRQAALLRSQWGDRGLHVPPFVIFSVTNRCNLHCAGCYHQAQGRTEPEMETDRLRQVLQEASELGISIALLAGGEPFMREDLLQVTAEFPQMIFPVFTNGLLLPDQLSLLQQQRNVLPIVSLEGEQSATDARRGSGLHRHLLAILEQLHEHEILFGVSLTVTRSNFELITSADYARQLTERGAKVLFYVEYVPVDEQSELEVLLPEQQQDLPRLMQQLRERFLSLFIAFPGDEAEYGGCLAAGRGFVHISASGSVEPCPFAPYSDSSLLNLSLREALQSPFLQQIREQHQLLQEVRGGCALWEKREWVKSLLADETTQSVE